MKLLTRSGLDWTAKFGKDLAAALKALPVGTALIDGELVVESQHGASDFSLLQADLSEGRTDRFVYYVFDLLLSRRLRSARDAAGAAQGGAGAAARRRAGHRALQRAFRPGRRADPAACLPAEPRRRGLEAARRPPTGPAAARAGSSPNARERQEFVIAGYVPSTTSRKAIGSLVLGYYDDGKLIHAGRVGTGFTAKVAADLYRRLERIRSPSSPFAETPERRRGAPGALRQAAAGGRGRVPRLDRRPNPAPCRLPRPARGQAGAVRSSAKRSAAAPSRRRAAAVKLTHPDRVYWPDAGVTKQGLAQYYAEVWRAHGALRRRPAAGAGALPAGHRGPVLLPEACLAGPEPQHPAGPRSPGPRGSAAGHRRSRRADRPGPGGASWRSIPGVHRSPNLEQPDHDHHGSRSRRGGELAGGHRRRRRGPRAACRRRACPASSRPRAARGCMSWRR